MLTGKSIYHVTQGIGKCFTTDCVKGYYNDLTAKVTMLPSSLNTDKLPLFKTQTGEEVEFPVEIIQYGLGAFDLYLLTGETTYQVKFMQSVEWAMKFQAPDGSWNNFFFIYPDHPYGAMVQGEGASLLLRAYAKTQDQKYLAAAQRALDMMLKPIDEGGTTAYTDEGPVLMEYTHLPAVLNGWVFAWWGLYDYVLTTDDMGKYREAMEASCRALIASLPLFSTNYWSNYDLGGRTASPHYQIIHIAQLQAMYQLTGYPEFAEYADRWLRYQKNPLNKYMAFMKKAFQKVLERE